MPANAGGSKINENVPVIVPVVVRNWNPSTIIVVRFLAALCGFYWSRVEAVRECIVVVFH